MFRHCPKTVFWPVAVLIGGCLPAAQVTAVGRSVDPLALHVAAFGLLGLLATSAYPFTRNSQLFVGLALLAAMVAIARIALGVDSGEAIWIWLIDLATSLAVLLLVGTIRQLFGRRLALPAPGSTQPWHRYVVRPALLVSLALAVGLLFSPRPLIEVADTGVLRIPLGEIMGLDEAPVEVASIAPGLEAGTVPGAVPGQGRPGLDLAVLSDEQLLPPLDRISAATRDEIGLPRITDARPSIPSGRGNDLRSLAALDYDLGGQLRSNGTIEVSKPLKIADRDTGELTLLIDPNSQIFADSGQISAIMPERAASLESSEGKFVSFAELRRSGIAISYDAVRDVVVIAN